jgi:syntaxin 1B/2/3
MEPLTQNGSQFGRQGDPNAILNECREIDNGISEIEQTFQKLRECQVLAINQPDNSVPNTRLVELTTSTVSTYKNLSNKLKRIKQKPESGSPKNAPQVGKVDRRLKNAIQKYQEMDARFRKDSRDQYARQYLIVHPDATDEEARAAAEEPGDQQVFSQALLHGNRRGQAQSTYQNVQNRHQAIQVIEKQMHELAQLFLDMDNLVVQQEAAVVNIEMKGEEVVENMDKGTEQIGVAIKSARNRNKLKWWCLGITSTFPFPLLLSHSALTLTLHSPNHHHRCRRRRSYPLRQPNHRQNYQSQAIRYFRIRFLRHPLPSSRLYPFLR